MNSTCEVIRDLLPLYHDGVCSNGSKSFVEEHLKGCPACRNELELINAELPPAHIKPKTVNAFQAASSAWKKSKKKSFLRGIGIAAAVFVLLLAGFFGLTQWKCLSVPADHMEVTNLSQLSDGCIVFTLSFRDAKSPFYVKYTATEDGAFYLTPMRSVIAAARGTGGYRDYFVFYPPGFKTSTPDHPGIYLPEHTTKIYIGPVGEGVLVWEAGMELPAASEAVEKITK